MCGIAGIWNTQNPDGARTSVPAMLRAMAHRGPDGRGILEFDGGAAGMVRLALVDLSDRGQQPMWSADRRVAILFNGEVYNFREERRRLEAAGHAFRSTSDTEVVLALYLQHGLDFVRRLRGMYALALFDWRERAPGSTPQLVLARDPFGIKPLYRATLPATGLIFASELRALLASGLIEPQVDSQALGHYLAQGFVQQPRTLLGGVELVPAGTIERYVPAQAPEKGVFWSMPPHRPRKETFEEAAERLRAVLDESVALHAMADAPVGAFLSGGVDSTGVVGLMRRHHPRLRTYTLSLPEFPGTDEAKEAIAASRKLECENTVLDVTGRQVRDLLPRFAAALDQPSVDGLNTWLISRAAARDVKGVLSGLGGDEWFAGYPVTRRMARARAALRGWTEGSAGQFAHRLGEWLPDGALHRKMERVAARRSPLALWMQTHTVFTPRDVDRLLGRGFDHEQLLEGVLDQAVAAWRNESPVGLSTLLDVGVYMRSQLLRDSDVTSMAHSLELRVPLVDVEVAAFSRSCSDKFKLARDGGASLRYEASGAKRVLIHALRDVLPPEIASREKKGFSMPLSEWMRTDLAPLLAETCGPEGLGTRGLVDRECVAQMYDEAHRGTNVEILYPRLWSLMILELWCRSVLDVRHDLASSRVAASV